MLDESLLLRSYVYTIIMRQAIGYRYPALKDECFHACGNTWR